MAAKVASSLIASELSAHYEEHYADPSRTPTIPEPTRAHTHLFPEPAAMSFETNNREEEDDDEEDSEEGSEVSTGEPASAGKSSKKKKKKKVSAGWRKRERGLEGRLGGGMSVGWLPPSEGIIFCSSQKKKKGGGDAAGEVVKVDRNEAEKRWV